MDTRQAVGWLHRRAGFGLHPTELDAAVERGADEELTRLMTSVSTSVDPWDGLALDPQDGGRPEAVRAWLDAMVSTTQPFQDRRTWMLHGWLVSSMDKVTNPTLMVEQIRLFMEHGGGSIPTLLRMLTTDRAMLTYLDGRTSTGDAPNENYGRELLELFTLGVGNYSENDVKAAARALTGWITNRRFDTAQFIANRHDDSMQTLLGVAAVHDVDTTIDAIVSDEQHARFVAERVAFEYLGDLRDPIRSDVHADLAATYTSADMHLDPVIDRALRLGLDGATTSMVIGPTPWLAMCIRATGTPPVQLLRVAQRNIREMGQVPFFPPSVAGWPTGTAWLTSSSIVARMNVASKIAQATADTEPLRVAAEDGDTDLLAEHLGLPDPFTPSTVAAIRSATDPIGRLTLALACPENLLS